MSRLRSQPHLKLNRKWFVILEKIFRKSGNTIQASGNSLLKKTEWIFLKNIPKEVFNGTVLPSTWNIDLLKRIQKMNAFASKHAEIFENSSRANSIR